MKYLNHFLSVEQKYKKASEIIRKSLFNEPVRVGMNSIVGRFTHSHIQQSISPQIRPTFPFDWPNRPLWCYRWKNASVDDRVGTVR